MNQELETTLNKQEMNASNLGRARLATGVVVVLVVLTGLGAVPRLARQRAALAAMNDSPVTHPVVSLTQPQPGSPTSPLLLPGNIEPLYTASIYARTEGYLDHRNVDIGSKVRAGQVLAVISSPEVDQQLIQARATLAQSEAALKQASAAYQQAKANTELARLTKERDVPLGQEHAISQQIVDEAVQAYDARVADMAASEANITSAQANVAANHANVSRLEELKRFEQVVAPFDGVITARNVERGDLVTTGSSTAGRPLFAVAQSGTLRVQIDVPQSEAVNIKDGDKTVVSVREHVGRQYAGTVVRNANALDSAARTMLTEVQVDNKDGSLLPGMYAQVSFTLTEQHRSLLIPTSALVINQAGMHVVTVGSNRKIHIIPVVIGRDLGPQVEVLSGLRASDSLIPSPSDLLYEGQDVQVQ